MQNIFQMQNNISTDRLLLDLLTEEDHEFIMQLVNSEGWIRFIGERNVHTKEDALAYAQKIMAMQNLFYWVVRMKEGNIPVGIISFLKRAYLDHYDIGFAFLPEYCGRGFAYEASKKIFDIALMHPEHQTILATTIPANTNSIKLLLRLGMHFEKEIEAGSDILHVYSNQAAG